MFTVQFLKILPFGQDFPFCKSSSHILQECTRTFPKLIQASIEGPQGKSQAYTQDHTMNIINFVATENEKSVVRFKSQCVGFP